MRVHTALVLGLSLVAPAMGQTPAKPKAKPAKSAPAPLAAPVKVTSVEGITEYRLGNGLRVLLFPDASKSAITTNITYLVGSLHESYGETGMAHLLEHLVFKPSQNFSGKDGKLTPVQALNKVGARFNGTTWNDRTNYFVTFPAGDENLKLMLDLEADRMVHANIDAKDLWDPETQKGEMTVVRNEMEGGENNPIRIAIQRVMSAAYQWHNYGHDTIGARADVEHVNIAHLRAFYEKFYQPDNAVFIVAGKIDEAKTLALVNETLGRIPKPSRVIEKTWTLDPTQDGDRLVNIRRVGDVQMLMAAYHTPAATDPDFAALQVFGQIMADTPSGRLHKALVDTKKAAFVFPFIHATKEPGLAIFGTQLPKETNLDEARGTFLDLLEGAAAKPFTEEEVARAKQQLLKQVELTLNESDRLGVGLSDYIGLGDWRLFFLERDRTKQVTPAQVQAVAAKYFRQSNRTVAQFIPTEKPERAEIPAVVEAASLVKDYKGGERVAAGEAFEATPANIDARTRTFTTPGGLKAAFLAKKTRGGSVSATLTLHFGSEATLMGKDEIGGLTASMLMRGTTKHTRQQLQDELDRLKAQVFMVGTAEKLNVFITADRANLPAVMALVTEVLRTPAFDAEEFGKLVSEQVSGLENAKNEPQSKASIAMMKHTSPYPVGHPRYIGTVEESIAQIKGLKVEDAKALHQAFYGATGELAVVGDFDDKALEAQVRELLGDWKAAQPFERMPERAKMDVAPLNAKLETPDKAQAYFSASLPLALKDSDPDYPALLLGNYLLGGGAMNSRIANRLRQKEGLSYGAGSRLQAGALDAVGAWSAMAIYAPQNLDRLVTAFQEELKLALDKGFTAEEIQAAKTGWLQGQASGRAQDRELAAKLAANLLNGRTLAFQADLEKKVQALTNDDILAALRKRLDPAKLNYAVAGDFAKAAKK
ncbi:MAG TPA: pitrilysin family protein [Holophagaceae bacterium]|nr:pitrilysin family protein [Holophagaceae bacterium]